MTSFTLAAAAPLMLMTTAMSAAAAPATRPGATKPPANTQPGLHAPLSVLDDLRAGHPRLLVLDEDVDRVAGRIQQDPTAKQYFDHLRKAADRMLKAEPLEHKLIGPRLLAVSRAALKRVLTLSTMYRLTGEPRYAERARLDMLTCAAFPDWNPSHFLDTAEMSAAMGIGYDWLYGGLSEEDRNTIRTAIIEKGLNPGLKGFRSGAWWSRTDNNWAQVCAGGLTVGALAIADEAPQLAADIVDAARKSMRKPMAMFGPDGACVEGPSYWAYATQYNVYYLAAVQSALGIDFGLMRTPGFEETGLFRIHTAGPAGQPFNFADAGTSITPAPQMFWLARAFDRPAYAAHERRLIDGDAEPLHLLWFDDRGDAETIAAIPRDALFRRVEVACFRSAWNDPDATYLAFKGGDNRVNHSHLDLGTFVLDAAGVRWAEELGPSDYNLPGYFGGKRWSYYRLSTAGQNTLTIDGGNQTADGKAPIIAYGSSAQCGYAVADLSDGYPPAQRVLRGVALLERKHVLVQDEFSAAEPVTVTWQMHTKAKATIAADGASAILTRDGQTLSARLLSPPGAEFAWVDAPAPAPQVPAAEAAERPTMPKLVVTLQRVRDARIVVLLTPQSSGAFEPKIEPLERWIEAGPLERKEPSR